MNNKIMTLCLVQDNDRVLLGMKKRGFGAGRWNGFGGKVEAGETIENAAKREIQEEAGVTISDIVKTGEIEFEFKGEAQKLEVNIFKAVSYQGEPLETEEMKPQWFKVSEIPFDQMWPDDIYWMPLFLEGKKFKGKFVFEGQSKIVEHKLEIFDA